MEEILKKTIWVFILLGVVVGMTIPQFGLVVKPANYYLLMMLMFFSCLNISIQDVINQREYLSKHVITLIVIHCIPCVLVYLMRAWFDPKIYIGLLLAASVSSGMSVTVLSDIFGGNRALALAITTISNFFVIRFVPWSLNVFAGEEIYFNALGMMKDISILVIVPYILARSFVKFGIDKFVRPYATYSSVVLLFLLISGVIAPVQKSIIADSMLAIQLVIIVSILVVINFVIGLMIGNNKTDKIAFGITASYKNFTLASVIALRFFPDYPLVAIGPAVYTLVNNILIAPAQMLYFQRKTRIWKRKHPPFNRGDL